jgi:hypothetical protein|tara:strand:+ start:1234 stop:1626 length:393 start_codon:yes stop_codon:yes gene_type:complete
MSNAPDIEIYVQDLATDQAIAWLEVVFSEVQVAQKKKGMPKKAQPLNINWQGVTIPVVVFEEVVPGFTSIWLDSSSLPWLDDRECAIAAAQFLHLAVRIAAGSWQQDDNGDVWIEILPDGSAHEISWKTD